MSRVRQARNRTIVALMGVLVLILGACSGGGDSTTTSTSATDGSTTSTVGGADTTTTTTPEELIPISLAMTNNLVGLPVFVGVEQGIFAKHGLDVSIAMVATGSDAARALQSRDVQLSASSTVSVIAISSGGVDVKMVGMTSGDATNASYDLGNGILARRDSGIDPSDPTTFKGKTIATNVGGSPHAYLLGYLEANGMSESDVTILNTPVPETVPALTQSLVDAIATVEPQLSAAAIELGDNSVLVSQLEGYTTAQVGLLALDTYIAENSDVLERFARGLAEAAQFARQNPEEAVEAALNYIEGLDYEVALRAHGVARNDPRISVCTGVAVVNASDAALEAGQITSAVAPEDVIDGSIMARVEASHPEFFDDLEAVPSDPSDC